MNSAIILVGTLILFIAAFRFYGRFLDRIYQIDPKNKTPAIRKYDGVDFVPAKNWFVLFGHHFSSICGAGPIVGPVLAVAYWGWGPSLAWILIGAVLMGAVADYSSLVVSVRAGGKSISEVAKPEISPRARTLFSLFIWLSLILVIAVFAIFAAKTFTVEKSAVTPSVGLIPVAIFTGWLLYRTKVLAPIATVIGLLMLFTLLWLGKTYPIGLNDTPWMSAQNIWILLLMIYCLVAAVTPVNILLQPRDYLASFLLIFTVALGAIAVLWTHPTMSSEAFVGWNPSKTWVASGPLFPMLFVTIACGAISGFHSLVSSGTTCKQLASEDDACRIGYGGMLTEGLVGVLVLICVAAGLSHAHLSETLRAEGPIGAFSAGYGSLSSFLLGDYGKAFAVLALNAFILTTLDSATRIARYITMDLFKVSNPYLATTIVVVAATLLAMTGQWQRIWPAFGTSNQLIAGLSLLVASCWLLKRRRPTLVTLIPSLIMLMVTTTAFIWQIGSALKKVPQPDYFIASVSIILIVLSAIIFWEAIATFRQQRIRS